MNDLISRQAAIDVLGVFTQTDALGHTPKQIVEALPSAQPEIVYCKDCICGHGEVWLSGNGSADLYGYCGRTQLRVLPYDYCSYAKRRTDD